MVNISGLKKAIVLAALYNNSRPQGLGLFKHEEGDMAEGEAQEILNEKGNDIYFDYLKGRVMKVDLNDDNEFDPRLYDRDNGQGAAQRAIDSIVGS